MKYTYFDNSDYPKRKMVFICDAANLLIVDEKYLKRKGKHPAKQKYISVRIGEEK